MPYIKVTNNEVRLGGLILTPEQEEEGYFHYEGAIPDGGKLMWDETNQTIYADLSEPKFAQKLEINKACKKTIMSGFYSDALGATHLYQSD